MSSESGDFLVFSPGAGYGILIGVGAAFSIMMVFVSWLLNRYNNEVQDSEMLSTAKRTMKTGLVASAAVSSWTIGSTLLLSCTTTYSLGVSASWWYGAGACVQIMVFSVAANRLKSVASNAHTFQEAVRVRYGMPAHLTMCCYSFTQQLFYTANLLVNGSAVFASITGVNREAACILLPLFVIIYTMAGGIKATFITDWVHVVIIYVLMLIFLYKAYATSDIIGSPGKMYDLLVDAGKAYPVAGNLEGSLLTFTSVNGGLFGLILFGAGWAAAVDSQLFQKGIAAVSNPRSVLLGYFIASIVWFCIPFVLATTMGLVCRALEDTPSFALYPDRLNAAQISNGLVLPVAAYTLMGKGGAGAVLIMVFMACTASFSSEIVAVSSLWTYDIYKAYINPEAKGKKLVFVTHAAVVTFSCCVIALAIGLGRANFDVSFITTCVGIFVNVNVIPMGCTLYWRKMSGFAMVASTTVGSCISIATWIGYAYSESHEITLTSLSTYAALAAGNTMAVGVPVVLVPIFVWIKPANFDWDTWKTDIVQADDTEFDKEHGLTNVLSGQEATEKVLEEERLQHANLVSTTRIGYVVVSVFVLFFLILFPIPLYASNYIFTKTFFKGYIVVAFIWAMIAAIVITTYPIAESIGDVKDLLKKIAAGKTGKVEVVEAANIDTLLEKDAGIKVKTDTASSE